MSAFQQRLTESGAFVLQGVDRKDYGSDCLIEAVDDERATNARIQIQLKGTNRAPNADGSVSIDVARTNLNYLMMQKHSFTSATTRLQTRCFAVRSTRFCACMNTGARTGPLRRL